jgi:hypothetical protein
MMLTDGLAQTVRFRCKYWSHRLGSLLHQYPVSIRTQISADVTRQSCIGLQNARLSAHPQIAMVLVVSR